MNRTLRACVALSAIAMASSVVTPAVAEDITSGKAMSDLTTAAMGGMTMGGMTMGDMTMGDMTMGDMTMGDRAAAKMHLAKMHLAKMHLAKTNRSDVMTSKLVGADVYNNQNDTIGKVEDLQIANGKSIAGVVVSVGGFLGMGESYVLVDPASFAVHDDDGTLKASLNASKDELKNAPKFEYKKKS